MDRSLVHSIHSLISNKTRFKGSAEAAREPPREYKGNRTLYLVGSWGRPAPSPATVAYLFFYEQIRGRLEPRLSRYSSAIQFPFCGFAKHRIAKFCPSRYSVILVTTTIIANVITADTMNLFTLLSPNSHLLDIRPNYFTETEIQGSLVIHRSRVPSRLILIDLCIQCLFDLLKTRQIMPSVRTSVI